MDSNRMEAFSDGVIAIIITIMVLELKAPHGNDWSVLVPLWPVFISYVLSFVYVGIYWNNHHHLLKATNRISGSILWANLSLLFCLSLIPFATAFLGENHFAAVPTALYGVVLFVTSTAYTILVRMLLRRHGKDSVLCRAIGSDRKNNVSLVFYLTAIGVAGRWPIVSNIIYVLVAVIWLVPDIRIERELTSTED